MRAKYSVFNSYSILSGNQDTPAIMAKLPTRELESSLATGELIWKPFLFRQSHLQ